MGPLTALLGAASEPPLTPDADEARRWLESELAKPEYHGGPSLLERAIDWVNGLFSDVPSLGIPGIWAALAIVGVLAALVVVAFVVTGPVRRRAQSATIGTVLDADDTRTAAELRKAADAAAAQGDWGLAVIERFRALARSLEERAILDERPGRTADEFAVDATPRFEALGADLVAAATLFDGVCYGSREARAGDDAVLRAVDQRLTATRPLAARQPQVVPG